MAKKSKKKKINSNSALLKNNIYSVKGSANRNPSKMNLVKLNSAQSSASKKAIAKAQQMIKIEAYAKEHKISITQAMVHFM